MVLIDAKLAKPLVVFPVILKAPNEFTGATLVEPNVLVGEILDPKTEPKAGADNDDEPKAGAVLPIVGAPVPKVNILVLLDVAEG